MQKPKGNQKKFLETVPKKWQFIETFWDCRALLVSPKISKTSNKGITPIALIITIIILLILLGVTISFTIKDGISFQANQAKKQTQIASEKKQIELAYISVKSNNKNLKNSTEFFEKIKEELNWKNASFNIIGSNSMCITIETGNEYTILKDGTILEGKVAYLNIADGHIDLYANGYKQYNGSLGRLNSKDAIPYTGQYIITGETKNNVIRVCDAGTYNITIKDLNIDVSLIKGLCAFNANKGEKETDCFVNISLEGDNYLAGGSSAAALGFSKAIPNVDGVTNGSTLTVYGNGSLEAKGGGYSAGIGGGYTGFEAAQGEANNIIINSGTIVAKAGQNGSAIGSAHGSKANNIVINGGNINAIGGSSTLGMGIGGNTAKNIIINDGNIFANACYGNAIGGYRIENLQINGGFIETEKTHAYTDNRNAGRGCIGGDGDITIRGGTIECNCKTKANNVYGVFSNNQTVRIDGGNIKINPVVKNQYIDVIPTDGMNNLYLTPIQLENAVENVEVTRLSTSDNLNYGIKDMNTSEEGIVYLYLPEGERIITIVAGDKTYTDKVITSENNEITILKEQ